MTGYLPYLAAAGSRAMNDFGKSGLGSHCYRKIPLSGKRIFSVTYWDLWLLILQFVYFAGDWETLLGHFRAEAKTSSWNRDKAEGIVNHALHLKGILEKAGITPGDLIGGETADFLKKQRTVAKRKLLEFKFTEYEASSWMIKTPRRVRQSRALRGYWKKFPVSPLTFAPDISVIFKTGKYYLESQSFKLQSKLSRFLETAGAHLDVSGQLALYRAFLTVVLENMNEVDDSYGVIGDLYGSVFETYYKLDRAQINLSLETYFQDLLELLIWEDYSFTFDELPNFFASLSKSESLLVERVLRKERQELCDAKLDYQSEEALTMLGLLYAKQFMFDRFVPIANEMGTREWRRITILAGAAEKRKHYDLALDVYEACLKPGRHEDYLTKEYEQLKYRLEKLRKKKSPKRKTK